VELVLLHFLVLLHVLSQMYSLHVYCRASAIIDDVKESVETYKYIVGWKDPLITTASLIIFIYWAYFFDPAYIASLPVFVMLLILIYQAAKRAFGSANQKFVQKEIEKNRKVRAEVSLTRENTILFLHPIAQSYYGCRLRMEQ
jgi:hypothetical protein